MGVFVLWDTNNHVAGQTVEVQVDDHLITAPDGWEWRPIEGGLDHTLALVNGVVSEVARSLPPEVALEVARTTRWAAAQAYRDARQGAGCQTPLGRVDTNPDSQRKISGAALAAFIAKSAGRSFSVDWTMADNSVETHDADAMIAMGMAVVAYLDACQKAGTSIREAIDAAATPDGATAIDVTAGYPVD